MPEITIRTPDDWHLHVRDGAMLKAVLPFTARNFGRAVLMPNLVPPVVTTADAAAYRERALAARLPRRRVHRGQALSRPRNDEFGRGRHRPQKGLPRAGAHAEDRHAVPDAW